MYTENVDVNIDKLILIKGSYFPLTETEFEPIISVYGKYWNMPLDFLDKVEVCKYSKCEYEFLLKAYLFLFVFQRDNVYKKSKDEVFDDLIKSLDKSRPDAYFSGLDLIRFMVKNPFDEVKSLPMIEIISNFGVADSRLEIILKCIDKQCGYDTDKDVVTKLSNPSLSYGTMKNLYNLYTKAWDDEHANDLY